jgi:hypothetical protein
MTDLNQNTDFLYPFIEGTEHDPDSLLLDLASSARGKAEVSARLQQASLEEYEDGLRAAGADSTPSATAGAPPMPRPWPRCSAARPAGAPYRPGPWPRTRRWSPRSATTWGSS